MIAEGKITIDLSAGGAVQIRSNRTVSVSSLLIGRKPEEALALLPVVFSLCAHAHVAAARAAMGKPAITGAPLLVLAENAREHLLRIMLSWKSETGIVLPSSGVMSLVPDMLVAIENGSGAKQAGSLNAYMKMHVFGIDSAQFLKIETLADLTDWLSGSETSVAVYLQNILAKNWQGIGAVTTDFLPDLPAVHLKTRMTNGDFCLQPDWLGQPRETGPLAWHYNAPIISAITEKYGAGLLARLVARLVDLAQIPKLMRSGGEPVISDSGIGVVETARGRLIHAAKTGNGKIIEYNILAPTEWNFHPHGVVAKSLTGLNAPQAQIMIEAIDPCVDFELRVA